MKTGNKHVEITVERLLDLIVNRDDTLKVYIKTVVQQLIDKLNAKSKTRNNHCANKLSTLNAMRDIKNLINLIKSNLEMTNQIHLFNNLTLDALKTTSILLGIKIDLLCKGEDRVKSFHFGKSTKIVIKFELDTKGIKLIKETSKPNATSMNTHNYLAGQKTCSSSFELVERIDSFQRKRYLSTIECFKKYMSLLKNQNLYKPELSLLFQHLQKPTNSCISCNSTSENNSTCFFCNSVHCPSCLSSSPSQLCLLCSSPLKMRRSIPPQKKPPAKSFKFFKTISSCKKCKFDQNTDLSFCSTCGGFLINPNPVLCCRCHFFIAENSSSGLCTFCGGSLRRSTG